MQRIVDGLKNWAQAEDMIFWVDIMMISGNIFQKKGRKKLLTVFSKPLKLRSRKPKHQLILVREMKDEREDY